MLAIILVSISLVILVVAGIIIAKGHTVEPTPVKPIEHLTFDTKYDEITFMYVSGKISDEEYKKQMKHILN